MALFSGILSLTLSLFLLFLLDHDHDHHHDDDDDDHDVLKDVTAGGAAGALGGFVSTPLDVVKTRLQTQQVQPGQQSVISERAPQSKAQNVE